MSELKKMHIHKYMIKKDAFDNSELIQTSEGDLVKLEDHLRVIQIERLDILANEIEPLQERINQLTDVLILEQSINTKLEKELAELKEIYSWKPFNHQTLEGLLEEYAFRFINGQEYYTKHPKLIEEREG